MTLKHETKRMSNNSFTTNNNGYIYLYMFNYKDLKKWLI